jgi:hypothetical protein
VTVPAPPTHTEGLRVIDLELITPDGTSEVLDFTAPMTLIRGPRNSSKTTMLKMIDFCLGDRDSAANALGAAVANSYLALELTISTSSRQHRLHRALSREAGPLTRIVVGESLQLPPREFDAWLLDELGWPSLMIPLGRDPQAATNLTPLTFRALLRHIYRKENSWLDFASREEEFLRQAVTSFFLGLAESRYSGEDYRFGEAKREVERLEAAVREATEAAAATLHAFTEQLRLPPANIDQLDYLESQLRQQLSHVEQTRQQLSDQMQPLAGYDPELGVRYEEVNAELERRDGLAPNLARA